MVQVQPDGRLLLRYDDGLLQHNVDQSCVQVMPQEAAAPPPSPQQGPAAPAAIPERPARPSPQVKKAAAKDSPASRADDSSGHGMLAGLAFLLGGFGFGSEKLEVSPPHDFGPGLEDDRWAAATQRRLQAALASGRMADIKAVLGEAQRQGLSGPEVRRAKEALLVHEASGAKRAALRSVEDAIKADEWWKLQAALQTIVCMDLGQEQVDLVHKAMRLNKVRQEALREVRSAANARDAGRLKRAVEAALKAHVAADGVRDARAALRTLEARQASLEQLQQALSSEDPGAIQKAYDSSVELGLDKKAPAPLGQDPTEAEALARARQFLQREALNRLAPLERLEDSGQLQRALESAEKLGASERALAPFRERLEHLHQRLQHKAALGKALEAADKEALLRGVQAAKEEGFSQELTEYAAAVSLIQDLEARERRAATRDAAAQELRAAAAAGDCARLAAALSAAEQSGLSAAEASAARERLRNLRAKAGALQDLREAVASGDLYRLRAALAVAVSASPATPKAELEGAREALKVLEAQAAARRSIQAALAARDPSAMRCAIEAAKNEGLLPRPEVQKAEQDLEDLGKSEVLQQLRQAMKSNDVTHLGSAARAASESGITGAEVDEAWARLRSLESQGWLRRQLHAAIESQDSVRLQATLMQAEKGGLSASDVAAARASLSTFHAQHLARQELQLARVSGNHYTMLAALRAAEDAGLPKEELDAARRATFGLSEGPPTDPKLISPPTQPQLYETVTQPKLPEKEARKRSPSAGRRSVRWAE